MLNAGRNHWRVGERVRVYRARGGVAGLVPSPDDETDPARLDPRDYDVEHYARVLRDNFASRLARAFAPDDYVSLFADPDQLQLFARPASEIRPVLKTHDPVTAEPPSGPADNT